MSEIRKDGPGIDCCRRSWMMLQEMVDVGGQELIFIPNDMT